MYLWKAKGVNVETCPISDLPIILTDRNCPDNIPSHPAKRVTHRDVLRPANPSPPTRPSRREKLIVYHHHRMWTVWRSESETSRPRGALRRVPPDRATGTRCGPMTCWRHVRWMRRDAADATSDVAPDHVCQTRRAPTGTEPKARRLKATGTLKVWTVTGAEVTLA